MIHFVVGEPGSFSIRFYLDEEGRGLRDRMRVVSYDELSRLDRLPLGTWVFTELDRFSDARGELANLACDRLSAAGGDVRVMNRPQCVLLRLDLLRAAHAAGLNRFRAWPATGVVLRPNARVAPGDADAIAAASLRYPVFVRQANRHTGNLTPLLDSPKQLERAMASLMASRIRIDELLVVEFCDTKDAHGVYRKCSAYKIGDRVMPRYLECSRDWMVKWDARIFDRERADEETRYLETNPHDAWIREIFRVARVDYGRIDYGVLDGEPQVWEINTNPTIGRGPGPKVQQAPDVVAYKAMMAPAFRAFYEKFEDAWRAVDSAADPAAGIALNAPPALLRALANEAKRQRRTRQVGSLVNAIARQPWVRPMTHLVKRGLATVAATRLRRGR